MSFFGFNTALPRDRGHGNTAPGFAQPHDAFAGLSGREAADTDAALDFDDTYDGLAAQLDETDDAFNDDTFGGEPATQEAVGRDFDFSGHTAGIARPIQEEQMLYAARQPPLKASPPRTTARPARTGYESYAEPEYIPRLEANASIWGIAPKKSTPDPLVQQSYPSQGPSAASARKMMSVEEVEAMLRAQATSKQPMTPQPVQQTQPPPVPPGLQGQPSQASFGPPPGLAGPPQILQRPQQSQGQRPPSISQPQAPTEVPGQLPQVPQILQRQRPPQPSQPEPVVQRQVPTQPAAHRASPQPRQILQNPNRLSGHGQPMAQPPPHVSRPHPVGPVHGRGPSYQGPVVTHPEQLLQLSDEDRAAFLLEDAKRAKRNHKIHLLSKDNGLMTPQDKNFITRIQLQQLVMATGGVDDQGPEAALAEDFYYQVYSQIRGAQRQSPHQPASQFAQTYLFQTGGRYGTAGRRYARGGDNHIQRMEQQVQRAVEAAKAKPKNKQLVIEGSLGKISFSNAKTPKPLLNIKRQDSGDVRPNSAGGRPSRGQHKPTVADRKATLRDIENVYDMLMQLEDHERRLPPPVHEDSDPAAIQEHMEWRQKLQSLNQRLWQHLKVMEPIIPNSPIPHPFIAILSFPKGKKAIPRVFRHIDEQQRITILTMMVVHLDTLDVIRDALATPNEPLPSPAREAVELFAQSVMPPLFGHINEAPLNIIVGLLGLVLDRTTIANVVRTKIGVGILTMLISRAELVKESSPPEQIGADWAQWMQLYNQLFDTVEPVLPHLFTGSVNDAEDVYVWQFLAAMAVGASPDQQQRLVLGVKERVMETVVVARALPAELAATRLGHVNLFMRAIGLDVELLS